jgi:precorrin-3B synthase
VGVPQQFRTGDIVRDEGRMSAAIDVKGWCPGALRPMESGDGLIVRLRISCGVVPLELASRVADWSEQFGNGLIDLSARANLQLRGVTPETLPALIAALDEAKLLDASVAAEAVRNVLVSPFSRLDPAAVVDARAIARALEERLTQDSALAGLPARFGFAVEDGGDFPLGDVNVDVRIEATRGVGQRFTLRLAGADTCIGPATAEGVVDAAIALAHAFLTSRRGDERRMRDLVARLGVEAIAQAAQLPILPSRRRANARQLSHLLGGHALGLQHFVGVAAPFGRFAARDFAMLAREAARVGATEMRLSPWRAIVIGALSSVDAQALANRLARTALVLDASDPRLRISACAGAPACASAQAPAREDAAAFAEALRGQSGEGVVVHVSGCAKGCAHPRPAAVTLVGAKGGYDLVLAGIARSEPVARDLTRPEALRAIAQFASRQGESAA